MLLIAALNLLYYPLQAAPLSLLKYQLKTANAKWWFKFLPWSDRKQITRLLIHPSNQCTDILGNIDTVKITHFYMCIED